METLTLIASVAAAIVLEAAPFLLVGSLLGALVHVLVPDSALRRLPRSVGGQLLAGLGAGLVLPVCECGIVPLARRLLGRGVPPRLVLAYMLAGPVLNPVALASTLAAYRGDWGMVLWRVILVLAPAAALALALGDAPAASLLRPPRDGLVDLRRSPALPACGCGEDHAGSRWRAVAGHTASEFMDMLGFLLLGALAAGACKVLLPPEAVRAMAGNPLLAVAGMMGLAVLLSVCSEADAFVAASFNAFPIPAQLAFLAIGPMLDLKLAPMYLAVFQRRAALALILVPATVVFLECAVMALSAAGY
jgi:uncharacterized membrane protein YraQ (UPF0718 family)